MPGSTTASSTRAGSNLRDRTTNTDSISNRKLAQNQAALSAQMDELGKMLVMMRKEIAELRSYSGTNERGVVQVGDGGHGASVGMDSVLGQDTTPS